MVLREKKLTVAAAWAFVVLGGWSLAHCVARAEELPRPCMRCELKVAECPILSNIPYVGKLFVNSPQETACTEQECPSDKGQLGIDWTGIYLNLVPATFVCDHGALISACTECDEAQCAATSENGQFALEVTGVESSCQECETVACSNQVAKCCAVTPFSSTTCADAKPNEHKICGDHFAECHAQMMDLVAENAALQASLQAKDQLLQLQQKMWQAFATMAAEKCHLQAQLAFSEKLNGERQTSQAQLHELAEENRRLEGLIEIATAQQEAELERQELARENERLKLRLAELEKSGKQAVNVSRVAKKPRTVKKDR